MKKSKFTEEQIAFALKQAAPWAVDLNITQGKGTHAPFHRSPHHGGF